MAKSSLDRFNQMIQITRFMAKICGADVMEPEYKMSIITWIVIIAINIFYACTIYTMYVGLIVEGDWKVVLQTLSLVGSAVQGYSKLLLCIRRRWVMIDMNEFLEVIYREYQVKEIAYQKVLRYRTDLTAKMLKIVLCIYIFTVVTIIFYPLVYWRLHGEKMYIMQFLIPGIDPLTEYGFLTHIGCQIFLMCLGGFGNFAGDMYIFIFIINIPLLRDILQVKFEQLNEVVLRSHDPRKTMPTLKSILKWHQKYNRYVQQVEEVYFGVIFIQISTSVVSICCTLFSIVIRSWPAAFAYLFYSVTLLYAYCGLGHLVEISNDGVLNTIYTDCLWYEFSIPERKLILLMLRKAQQPTTLTIGKIMSLSMSSALQLTKCIYSYMMMILNFLDES